jgi:hypothetical protein
MIIVSGTILLGNKIKKELSSNDYRFRNYSLRNYILRTYLLMVNVSETIHSGSK